MEIDNIKDLRNWLDNDIVSDDEKSHIEIIIKAFSDYITAVDPEYLYNKTFLKDFIPAFISSNEKLNIKKEFLIKLIDSLCEYKGELKIEIDNAWLYDETKDSKIILLNNFNKSKVNSDKLYYQIKYDGEKSFVIADCVELDKLNKDMDTTIEEVKNLCSDRFKIDYEN